MGVYWAPYVELVVSASPNYSSGDALGAKSSFTNVPEGGVIMGVNVIDRADQSVNIDLVLFHTDIAGTADNAAFAPTDAELETCLGAILVDTWKTFNANAIGSVDNVGFPYWAKGGVLFFQCVTRGAHNLAATDDIRISIGIVY